MRCLKKNNKEKKKINQKKKNRSKFTIVPRSDGTSPVNSFLDKSLIKEEERSYEMREQRHDQDNDSFSMQS